MRISLSIVALPPQPAAGVCTLKARPQPVHCSPMYAGAAPAAGGRRKRTAAWQCGHCAWKTAGRATDTCGGSNDTCEDPPAPCGDPPAPCVAIDSPCECEHNNPDSLDARLFFTVVLAIAPAVAMDEASSLSVGSPAPCGPPPAPCAVGRVGCCVGGRVLCGGKHTIISSSMGGSPALCGASGCGCSVTGGGGGGKGGGGVGVGVVVVVVAVVVGGVVIVVVVVGGGVVAGVVVVVVGGGGGVGGAVICAAKVDPFTAGACEGNGSEKSDSFTAGVCEGNGSQSAGCPCCEDQSSSCRWVSGDMARGPGGEPSGAGPNCGCGGGAIATPSLATPSLSAALAAAALADTGGVGGSSGVAIVGDGGGRGGGGACGGAGVWSGGWWGGWTTLKRAWQLGHSNTLGVVA